MEQEQTTEALESLDGFSSRLASKAPTPGGGGAAAAVGALACALGEMVCNLTIGKPKYSAGEQELIQILKELEADREHLLELIDADAVAFTPVAQAYAIPKSDPKRAEIMERALCGATEAPIKLMESITHVIIRLNRLAVLGSRLALSDVGVAAVCAAAALEGASLNVYINTAAMTDREQAAEYEHQSDALINMYANMARNVYEHVMQEVRA